MLLFILFTLPLAAQDACGPFITRLHGQMEARDYEAAYGSLETAPADCAYTDKAYADAEQLLKIRLDNAKPEEKQDRMQALFTYYDKFDQVNPANSKGHLIRKAKAYKRYADDAESAWKLLERAYAQDRASFSDAEALYDYFTGYHAQYAAGKVSVNDLVSRYAEISGRLATEIQSAERKQPYRFAMRGVDALMDREMACDKLLPVFTSQYAANKDNVTWLSGTAASLNRKKCFADTLHTAVVRRWHKLSPTAESALALADVETRGGNVRLANDLFAESASLEKDPLKKAESFYKIATRLATSDPASAYKWLDQALVANPKMGRAYLLKATLIANSQCGRNDFERRALNFLAEKTALKALAVQPEMKATAEAQAQNYRNNQPKSAEIKASGYAGKTLKFSCWLTDAVQIPSK